MALGRRDELPSTTFAANDLNALLGPGCEFRGKLSFRGKVRIDGNFEGEIATDDVLVIGEGARVAAQISCGSLVCRGEIVGDVRARNGVELHPPARLTGDVTTPSLVIDKGVVFDGASRMDDVETGPLAADLVAVAPLAAVPAGDGKG